MPVVTLVNKMVRRPSLALILVGLLMSHVEMRDVDAREMPRSEPILETGLWLVQDREGVVDISFCGAKLCGRLVGMRYEGPIPKDKWGRSQCGLYLLTDFTRDDAAHPWRGRILDPEKGRIYDAQMHVTLSGVLSLRGFVMGMPLLGKTQTWTRYTGRIGANCKLLSTHATRR